MFAFVHARARAGDMQFFSTACFVHKIIYIKVFILIKTLMCLLYITCRHIKSYMSA